MATVIGIFEDFYKRKKPLPVVKPGSQSRRFTHIRDTIEVCFKAWKKNKCQHYSISHKKSYSILAVAKLFKSNKLELFLQFERVNKINIINNTPRIINII